MNGNKRLGHSNLGCWDDPIWIGILLLILYTNLFEEAFLFFLLDGFVFSTFDMVLKGNIIRQSEKCHNFSLAARNIIDSVLPFAAT